MHEPIYRWMRKPDHRRFIAHFVFDKDEHGVYRTACNRANRPNLTELTPEQLALVNQDRRYRCVRCDFSHELREWQRQHGQ